MIPSDYDDVELDELLHRFCNGNLNDEWRSCLEAKINASEDACRRYVEFVYLCVGLSFANTMHPEYLLEQIRSRELGKTESDGALSHLISIPHALSPAPYSMSPGEKSDLISEGGDLRSTQTSSFINFNWGVFGAGIATALLFSLGLLLLFRPSGKQLAALPETTQKFSPKNIAPLPVAYLISSNGCSWADSSTLLVSSDHGVQKGDELNLLEGIAEFRLSSGVSLSVEGPVGIVLTSPTSLVLKYGKVTAQVPWSAKDFRILAGICRFEAYDAEFGISVTGARVDAHAFSGKVFASNMMVTDELNAESDNQQIQQSSKANVPLTRAVIKQGRALTLLNQQEGNVKITGWNRAKPSFFATKLSMAGELPITEDYIKAVLISKPAAYWRFESDKNSVISSEISTGCDLNIVGNLRLPGTAGNRVAEFYPGSECYLISRDTLDWLAETDYSVELWLKPSHIHSSAVVSACATDPESRIESHAFMLELQNSGRQQVHGSYSIEHPFSLRFLHRSPPSRSAGKGTSCFSKDFYNVRRWQHVVAVKHGDQMQLFIDGKLSGSANDPTTLVSGLRLLVGRQQTSDNVFHFIGQLDELAIYTRALSQDEIEKHYRAVNWAEVRNMESDSGI